MACTQGSDGQTHLEGREYFSNIKDFQVSQDFYGRDYFEGSKQLTDTGYDNYADGDWAYRLALFARDFFAPASLIDVGCARGYVVRRLREWGVPAFGTDYSAYALKSAPPELKPLLTQADATALPFRDRSIDMLMCIETLEHLYPDAVPLAARELARVAKRWLLLSIPTFGVDEGGAVGIPIVDPEHRADAEANRPFRKLVLDPDGQPHHGHLTLATWQWWTEQFETAGLRRIRWLERRINAHPLAAPETWHFYVFAHPGVVDELAQPYRSSVCVGATLTWMLGDGWHDIEVSARPYRWTTRSAHVKLDYAGQRFLEVEVAGAVRAAELEVFAGETALGRYAVAPGWQTLRIPLPGGMPPGILDFELRVPAPFVPARSIQGSDDTRELGVMVSTIELM